MHPTFKEKKKKSLQQRKGVDDFPCLPFDRRFVHPKSIPREVHNGSMHALQSGYRLRLFQPYYSLLRCGKDYSPPYSSLKENVLLDNKVW